MMMKTDEKITKLHIWAEGLGKRQCFDSHEGVAIMLFFFFLGKF